jgi:hypothetical protein
MSNDPLVFALPKRLSVEEVRKIAPAVAPPDGQIGVWPSARDGDASYLPFRPRTCCEFLFKVIDRDGGLLATSLQIARYWAEVRFYLPSLGQTRA